jgi:hypothetical protein
LQRTIFSSLFDRILEKKYAASMADFLKKCILPTRIFQQKIFPAGTGIIQNDD